MGSWKITLSAFISTLDQISISKQTTPDIEYTYSIRYFIYIYICVYICMHTHICIFWSLETFLNCLNSSKTRVTLQCQLLQLPYVHLKQNNENSTCQSNRGCDWMLQFTHISWLLHVYSTICAGCWLTLQCFLRM